MLSAILLALLAPPQGTTREALAYDRYGGVTHVTGRKTGFFHVELIGRKWWLITPEGHGFISKGVCHVSYAADHAPSLGYSPYGRVTAQRYGSEDAWAQATAQRMKTWGLNSVGAWSSAAMNRQGLAYAPILNVAASLERDLWLRGGVVDVFARAFRDGARKLAVERCGPLKGDPWVLGYFTDNELRWGPDWRSKESLLESFLKMPEGSAGRRRADEFLRTRKSAGDATDDDKAAFLELVAEQYFKVCAEAIRAADPNHMVIGCRFAGYAPEAVLRGLRRHVDVVSYNDYSLEAPVWNLERLTRVTGRPFMITEFSFKAKDSGLPNTRGAGVPVETQNDRADRFERYVTTIVKMPQCVGYHWFEWCDEPREGRFDGENSNYGLVRINDTPWEELTQRLASLNAGLERLR